MGKKTNNKKQGHIHKNWENLICTCEFIQCFIDYFKHTTLYRQDNMAVAQLHDVYYYYQQEANPTANEFPLEKLKINGQSAIILTTLKPLVGHFIAPVQSVLCKAIIHARKGLCEREREKERPDIYLNRI